MNQKQSKTATLNYSNYSLYPRKEKCKLDMQRSGFLSDKEAGI